MKTTLILMSTSMQFQGGEFQSLVIAHGLLQRDYDIIIICRKNGAYRQSSCPSARWIFLEDSSVRNIHLIWRSLRNLSGISHGVLFCTDYSALLIGVIVTRLIRIPLITVHHFCRSLKQSRLHRLVEHFCTEIIAGSTPVATCLSKVLPDIPISVIPDTTQFKQSDIDSSALRENYGIERQEIIGLSVADFSLMDFRLELLEVTADLLHQQ